MTDRPLTDELPGWLAARQPRVTVVGDSILDGWLSGECRRLAREAPAPVLDVSGQRYAPGGAANTAVNLAALGARVRLVSVVGDDRDGTVLLDELRAAGVEVSSVLRAPGRATVCKRRLVAGAQLLARVDQGAAEPLPESVAARLGTAIEAAGTDCDALLVCDYGLGVGDERVLAALARLRPELPLFAVDAHDVRRWARLRPDFVTPNVEETAAALGNPLPDEPDERLAALHDQQSALHAATGAAEIAVTLDRHGSALLSRTGPLHRTWADPVPEHQTAGAGDTYCAAVCLARAAGLPMTTAVELGQAAADVAVRQGGTSVCTTAQLAERLGRFRSAALPAPRLAEQVAAHRAAGRRIVFTNGCFDVLHRGHVAYLNQAKRLGDVLVVGVNGDASVRRLKGPTRPVNGADDRAAVLAALSCVDHVTVFDADDAVDLVRLLRPDVYAKGGDYTPDMLPETGAVREGGGEVRILDYLPERSTTAVLDRIRASVPAGGA